jgi:hypothetical protein
MSTRTQLDDLMVRIEEMWGHLHTLFEDLNTSDGWDQKHGPDWTFADVPYHLTYFNRDLVVRSLELGLNHAKEEVEPLVTPENLSDWNTSKLAQRPAYQTPLQSVSRWQVSCEEIYRLTARLNDADLDQHLFWMPLLEGPVTIRRGLELCLNHDWSMFTQLRIHMGRTEPLPNPAITRGYLGSTIKSFPMLLNKSVVNHQQFTAVLAFADPGVGAWTIRVTDGAATAREGDATNPDLVMTQSAEAFEKYIRHIQTPGQAIQAGEIQVSSFESLDTFGQLFPMQNEYSTDLP